MPAHNIFATTDYDGRPVVLTNSTWHAKAGNGEPGAHPEIRDYVEEVRRAVESPDLVFQSQRDPRSHLLILIGAGRGSFAGKHLVVVVKYLADPTGTQGYVSTMYLSRSIHTKGQLVWPRTQIPIR